MKATVWSRDNCLYCQQSISLLSQKGFEIEERKIGDIWTKEDLLKVLPEAKSVPQIFIEETYVGGSKQLEEYLKKNSI